MKAEGNRRPGANRKRKSADWLDEDYEEGSSKKRAIRKKRSRRM